MLVRSGDVDFVAIDFETANSWPGGMCSVGLAYVEGGSVVEVEHYLIRPLKMYFHPFHVQIHGIREWEVRGAPEWPELWENRLREKLEGRLLIAHNASFDMGVIRQSCDAYGISWPTFEYHCTRLIARRIWPELENYKLNTVAASLGIGFTHHRADEDAVACARVALGAMEKAGEDRLRDLIEREQMVMGQLSPGLHIPAGSGKRKKRIER